MKRGEVWTVAGGVYVSKPRPAMILQAASFLTLESVTVAPFTTDPAGFALFRLDVSPTTGNGLRVRCRLMIDKITTVPRRNLGFRLGELEQDFVLSVSRAAALFLGIG